jgi:hypothetical protein
MPWGAIIQGTCKAKTRTLLESSHHIELEATTSPGKGRPVSLEVWMLLPASDAALLYRDPEGHEPLHFTL